MKRMSNGRVKFLPKWLAEMPASLHPGSYGSRGVVSELREILLRSSMGETPWPHSGPMPRASKAAVGVQRLSTSQHLSRIYLPFLAKVRES